MEVRRLGENDAEALWNLRLHALQTEPASFGEAVEEHRASTVPQIADRLRSGTGHGLVFGAFDKGRLVGMVGLHHITRVKRAHTAEIWGMYVSADHRRSGLGRELMEEALRAARMIPGVRLVNLTVTATNEAARRLYVKLGFRPWGLGRATLKIGDQYYDEEWFSLEL